MEPEGTSRKRPRVSSKTDDPLSFVSNFPDVSHRMDAAAGLGQRASTEQPMFENDEIPGSMEDG